MKTEVIQIKVSGFRNNISIYVIAFDTDNAFLMQSKSRFLDHSSTSIWTPRKIFQGWMTSFPSTMCFLRESCFTLCLAYAHIGTTFHRLGFVNSYILDCICWFLFATINCLYPVEYCFESVEKYPKARSIRVNLNQGTANYKSTFCCIHQGKYSNQLMSWCLLLIVIFCFVGVIKLAFAVIAFVAGHVQICTWHRLHENYEKKLRRSERCNRLLMTQRRIPPAGPDEKIPPAPGTNQIAGFDSSAHSRAKKKLNVIIVEIKSHLWLYIRLLFLLCTV